MINTAQAAERLNLSRSSVLKLIQSGRLPASKRGGRDYLINEADLELVRVRRKVGRPRKDGSG